MAASPDWSGASRCAATRQNAPAGPLIAESASAGPILPGGRAIGGGQVAPHPARLLASGHERVRERAVRQPGDVVQPFGVGERDAERPGDVQPVRPVLGQPRGGQRGRLERRCHPGQRLGRIGRAQRVYRLAPGRAPAPEGQLRLGAFGLDKLVGCFVHRAPGERRPAAKAGPGGRWPPPPPRSGRGGRRRRRTVQPAAPDAASHWGPSRPEKDVFQPVLFVFEIVEYRHGRTMAHLVTDR